MPIIEYTPWTEDKEEAKKQLAEYVQEYPKEGFMFDSNTPRPDTTYLLNSDEPDEPVAEIFTVFIEEAAAENENIGEGLSYRDVLNNTSELAELQTENIDETVSIIGEIKNYIGKYPKTTWVAKAIVIFFLVFLLSSMLMNAIFESSSNENGIIKSEHRFYASQGYMVGKFIAKNISNAKVLLIENEDFKKSKYEQALITALKEGMGNSNVKATALKSSSTDFAESQIITNKNFDNTISANSSSNVIVISIALLHDNAKMKLWKMPEAKRPKVILINRNKNDLIKLDSAIKKGMVSAVVIINPKAKLVAEASLLKLENAFKKRYILVDKNNLTNN